MGWRNYILVYEAVLCKGLLCLIVLDRTVSYYVLFWYMVLYDVTSLQPRGACRPAVELSRPCLSRNTHPRLWGQVSADCAG